MKVAAYNEQIKHSHMTRFGQGSHGKKPPVQGVPSEPPVPAQFSKQNERLGCLICFSHSPQTVSLLGK